MGAKRLQGLVAEHDRCRPPAKGPANDGPLQAASLGNESRKGAVVKVPDDAAAGRADRHHVDDVAPEGEQRAGVNVNQADTSATDRRQHPVQQPRLRPDAGDQRPPLRGRLAVVDGFQVAQVLQVAVAKIARHRGHSAGQRRQRPELENARFDGPWKRRVLDARIGEHAGRRLAIEAVICCNHGVHAVSLDNVTPSGLAQRAANLGARIEFTQRIRKSLRVAGRRQTSASSSVQDLGHSAHVRCHARQAARHGLEQSVRMSLAGAGQDEHVQLSQKLWNVLDMTGKRHAACHPEFASQPLQPGSLRALRPQSAVRRRCPFGSGRRRHGPQGRGS